jgi:predicted DNA-binding transcriptional regulator AlpA
MTPSSPQEILRLPQGIKITGLKAAGIYKAINEKRFPRPVPLLPGSRHVGWLASEIAAHQKKCIAERDKPKSKRGRAR